MEKNMENICTYNWATLLFSRNSLMAQVVKNPPAMQKTQVWSPGWEDALDKEMATHSSMLGWRIPQGEEPGGLQPMRSHESDMDKPACQAKCQKTNTTLSVHYTSIRSVHSLSRVWLWDTILLPSLKDLDFVCQLKSIRSVQSQSCPILCDPMVCSISDFPVHHQLPEFTQTCVHWVGDATQPSHLLLSPSPPAFNLSQHQGLFQWDSSSHQVAKVLKFQLQHQYFQWIFRTDFL